MKFKIGDYVRVSRPKIGDDYATQIREIRGENIWTKSGAIIKSELVSEWLPREDEMVIFYDTSYQSRYLVTTYVENLLRLYDWVKPLITDKSQFQEHLNEDK